MYQLSGKLFLKMANDNGSPIHMDIIGAEGRILFQKDIEHPFGDQLLADINFLKPGIYIARVYSAGHESTFKFFKD